MVRHYKAKSLRAQWSEETLKDAIAAVETGVSLKKASKDFSIPRTTLRNHLKLKEKGGQFSTKKRGRPTVLSSAQETELVNLILDYEARLFGLTVLDIRRLVYDYCEKNDIKNNFSHTYQCAGEDWARAFIARHCFLVFLVSIGLQSFEISIAFFRFDSPSIFALYGLLVTTAACATVLDFFLAARLHGVLSMVSFSMSENVFCAASPTG